MAIQSLPTELLRLTLQIGAKMISDFDEANQYEERMKKRNTFLLAVSLVCRRWRVEGQSVLWEEIYIGSEKAAWNIEESPLLGSLQNRELTIEGNEEDEDEGVSATSVETILSTVAGLRILRIYTFLSPWNDLKLDILCSKNLRGAELPLFYLPCALIICLTRQV